MSADQETASYDYGRLLVSGAPLRALQLTDRGAEVAAGLLAGVPVADATAAALARRLLDGGLAHPVVAARDRASAGRLEVVVPVYGAAGLSKCLAALVGAEVVVVDDGSPDADAIAAAAARYGARLLRLPVNGGPAVARNAGLAATTGPVVAFVDSDAVTGLEALLTLAAQLDDPVVAMVAPRIRPALRPAPARSTRRGGRQLLDRIAATGSRLDLGPRGGPARPGGRPSYVPSTVVVARRTALEAVSGFDPGLRIGEDVDLVWRLGAAGWTVRYVPEVAAGHVEPATWRAWLGRSRRYGTSAGPLADRHPGNGADALSPPAAPVAAVLLAVTGRRGLATVLLSAVATRIYRRLHAAGVPAAPALRMAGRATGGATEHAARWLTQIWAPALLVLAFGRGRSGRGHTATTAAVLLVPPVLRVRAGGGPWPAGPLALLADDIAYGAGVWAGCLRVRTARPLLPRLTSVPNPADIIAKHARRRIRTCLHIFGSACPTGQARSPRSLARWQPAAPTSSR